MFYVKKLFLRISLYLQETSVLEFLFNKVAGLQAYNFIKKRLQRRCFSVNVGIFKDTNFEEHLWTAASNYGYLAVFRENLLYWVEEINYFGQSKIAILRKTIY